MPIRHWGARLFLLCAVFLSGRVHARQMEATVKMTLDRLPLDKQDKLKELQDYISVYLSDYDWTGEDFEEPVPVGVQIFLQDKSSSFEDRYGGTFLISNGQDIQYYDKYWDFPYQAGEALVHNENVYNPFTGFLNFYAYIILGGEYDKFGPLAGSPYFEKARRIADQAMFDSQNVRGWKERKELIEKILSEDRVPFRKMKDLFFSAFAHAGEDDSLAVRTCGDAVALLEGVLKKDPEQKDAVNFLKAYHIQILELCRSDQNIIRRIAALDPDRAETYKKYMK
ncbi:DUF4835 family protein [bacterium]|nr:DUF4835 family protein [bacterium]